jgi:prepilin-type N-terminal cleavage/methylation domain-containing protein
MQKALRKKKGFTILEVMVAAFVMAFAIMTAITTMQRAFLSLDTARNITIAGQIMQSEFEKMRMNDWSTISGYTTGSATTLTIDTSFTSNSFIGNRFTLVRNVSDIVTGTTAGMKQITLTVSWKSYDGHSLSRSYMSYYGQNGLYDYFYNSIY